MEDTAARSDAGRELERLEKFVTTALPALERAGVMHMFLLEVNRLVGRLDHHRHLPGGEHGEPDADADALLGLMFAIEAAQAGVSAASRALGYVKRHFPELREAVARLERQLAAPEPSPEA